MTTKLFLLVLLISLSGTHAAAQGAAGSAQDNREVINMGLYPPDILMRQQQRLGITNDQRKAIAQLVQGFQGEVTELQWSLPNEQQTLRDLLRAYPVDSAAAVNQAKVVLELESSFKRAHFELLIAIKNELTSEQVETLDTAIRRRMSAQNNSK